MSTDEIAEACAIKFRADWNANAAQWTDLDSYIRRAIAEAGYQGYLAHEFIPTGDPIQALREAYERSGKFIMHLQQGVFPFDSFVRCIGVGPQTKTVQYDPSKPLHERYLPGEGGQWKSVDNEIAEFLADGVDSVRSETVRLKLINPLRPGLITSADDESFWYLIRGLNDCGAGSYGFSVQSGLQSARNGPRPRSMEVMRADWSSAASRWKRSSGAAD